MAVRSGTYRGVSAADRAAERRSRLLEATLTVWAGEDRVTMTRICAEAGLSERYFYESFQAVDDALVAVMEWIAAEIEATAQAAADATDGDLATRMRASVRAFVALIDRDPRKGRVAIIESAALPQTRRQRTALLRRFAHRAASELHAPPRSDIHGEVAGLLFIGGMAELVTAWLDGAIDATPDDLADAVVAMFVGR
ncbi:TetR/AcrR family transcriptional regulator [Rhodococcus gannanensis]|uniref:TetR/AcrR family transcriptional regulator n=1 Tax=Rhodococcus gannanensis TaxID=1960308 RepID=A0ABW4PBJ0_9NOCA